MFVVDSLGVWLVGFLADAGRRKLTGWMFGSDQERALGEAARAAVERTAMALRPADLEKSEEMAAVISQVFAEPFTFADLAGQGTLLGALQSGIAGQLAVLDDPGVTGTGQSSADVLGIRATTLADTLTTQLLREIVDRASRGGPLFPLASQLNDDVTHLQVDQVKDMLQRLGSDILEALAQLQSARLAAPAPVVLAQLPSPTSGFTGRQDELAVLAALLDPAEQARQVVVSALAGAGKTALAVHAGHAAAQNGWFSGVLFLDLHGYDDQPVQPAQALDALLRALGVPAGHIPPTGDQRAALYRSVLAQFHEPVLLIADNASSEAQVRPLLPGSGPHKVLVTSRHILAGLGARLVGITVLDPDESVLLLDASLRSARPGDGRIARDPQAASRLAVACGGLPLALQISAAQLKADETLTAGELVYQLSDETERLRTLRYDDGSGASEPSVAAAFGLSYRRLDEPAARVFRLLALCPGPDMCSPAAAALADLPVREARAVLAGLARAHLLEASPGTVGRWRMHDLVHLYARQLSDAHTAADGRELAVDRLFAYYLETTTAADGHLRALPDTQPSDAFPAQADALAWLDAERPGLVSAVAMAAESGRWHIALRLPLALAEYLALRRRLDDWVTTATICVNAARSVGDRSCEGLALDNLGNSLRASRQFDDAIAAHQEDLAICRMTGDRHGEGSALTNLGNTLRDAGQFEDAITAHREAAAILRQAGDRHGEGQALNNLGNALQDARRFGEAITAHRESAALCREMGNQRGEGAALASLGGTLRAVGQLKEAIAACQKSITILRATADRHREAGAMTNLGDALYQAGRFDEALTAFQEAAAIFSESEDEHNERIVLAKLNAARDAHG